MDLTGLTPLGDFAHQNLFVGNPPAFLFTEDGKRVDRDLVALSIQLRQAQAMERLTQSLDGLTQITDEVAQTAHVSIQLNQALGFRNLIDRVVRTLWPKTEALAITGWEIIDENSVLKVSLNYTNGEALIMLGLHLQELNAELEQEGGQRA